MKKILCFCILLFSCMVSYAQENNYYEIIQKFSDNQFYYVIEHEHSAQEAFEIERNIVLELYKDYQSKIELEDSQTSKLVFETIFKLPMDYVEKLKLSMDAVLNFSINIDNKDGKTRIKFSHTNVDYTTYTTKVPLVGVVNFADQYKSLSVLEYVNYARWRSDRTLREINSAKIYSNKAKEKLIKQNEKVLSENQESFDLIQQKRNEEVYRIINSIYSVFKNKLENQDDW